MHKMNLKISILTFYCNYRVLKSLDELFHSMCIRFGLFDDFVGEICQGALH